MRKDVAVTNTTMSMKEDAAATNIITIMQMKCLQVGEESTVKKYTKEEVEIC